MVELRRGYLHERSGNDDAGPNVRELRGRLVQRDVEPDELHGVDQLHRRLLREHTGDADPEPRVHALRRGHVHVGRQPEPVLVADGLPRRDRDLSLGLRGLRGRQLLPRGRDAEGSVRRRDVGSRREPGDGVHPVVELRRGIARERSRQRDHESDVSDVLAVVHDVVEPGDLHAVDELLGRQLREHGSERDL